MGPKAVLNAWRTVTGRQLLLVLTFILLIQETAFPQSPDPAGQMATSPSPTGSQRQPSAGSSASQRLQSVPVSKAPLRIMPMIGNRLPAAHAAGLPEVPGSHMTYFGGPVISNVHIVQVLYGTGNYLPNVSSTASPSIAGFLTDVTQSSYFDMLSEYSTAGVVPSDGGASSNQIIGHGLFDGQFTITPSPANNGSTISDDQVQSELLSQVSAGKLPAPVLDAQGNNETLYLIYFPPGKTISLGKASSCQPQGFCAYHNSTTSLFASRPLLYGVLPDMQPPSLCANGCASSDPFANVTIVTSHEMSEAVTDPEAGGTNVAGRPLAWLDPLSGAEIGDVCQSDTTNINTSGQPYVVQQEFSNLQNGCTGVPATFLVGPSVSVTPEPGVKFDLMVMASSPGTFVSLPNYRGTIHFSSSDPAATLPSGYTYTYADAGSHSFVAGFNTMGNQTITVTDTQLPITGSMNTQLSPPALTLAMLSASVAGAGSAMPVQVTVSDDAGNVAKAYSGTLHFSSTDPAAVLPPDSALPGGTGTFLVTFKTVAINQTLTVSDASNLALNAHQSVRVNTAPSKPTATTVTISPNPSVFGGPATYTATVTGGTSPLGGSVTFRGSPDLNPANGGTLGSVPVDATGHASITLKLPGGANPIVADYEGPSGGSSAIVTAVVNPAPTTLNVTSSKPDSVFGDSVTFSATISSSVALNARSGLGTVVFNDGAVPIASVQTLFLGNGLDGPVTFSTPALPVGQHSVTATFTGTPSFAAATSAPAVQNVSAPGAADYSLTANTTSATIVAGQLTMFAISTQSLNGFTGTIKFACGVLPALTTCSFQPNAEFVVTEGTNVSTLVVQTTGPHASLTAPKLHNSMHAGLWTSLSFAFGMVVLIWGRRQGRGQHLALFLLACIAVGTITSCGGGGSSAVAHPPVPTPTPVTATPAGTSVIVVTATATSASGPTTTTTKQLNLSLTVTQ